MPNELNEAGFCAKSHPEFNVNEARDGETYPQLYGWTYLVPYGAGGILNTRKFDIRGSATGQALTLIRDGEIIGKWQGDTGPEGVNIEATDVLQFFADDSNSCFSDGRCTQGFEVRINLSLSLSLSFSLSLFSYFVFGHHF